LVPLHPTAKRALCRYAQTRFGTLDVHDNSPFFVNKKGNRLTYGAIRWNFDKLREMLGWTQGNGEWPRPRIHDLRHTFACQRLLFWYRHKLDVHHLIAALSTYLGHGKVSDTYWYLTSTPELLAIVGGRFERFADTGKGEPT
jgi:integrase